MHEEPLVKTGPGGDYVAEQTGRDAGREWFGTAIIVVCLLATLVASLIFGSAMPFIGTLLGLPAGYLLVTDRAHDPN